MIAAAPGVGMWPKTVWIRSLAITGFSAVLSGAVVGAALSLPPPWIMPKALLVVLLFAAATVAAAGIRRPRRALWRVPRRAHLVGSREGVGFVFGAALGSGFATELASYGLIAMAAWAIWSHSVAIGPPMFAAFGLFRGLPVLGEAMGSSPRRKVPGWGDGLTAWERHAPKLGNLEAATLAVVVIYVSVA